MLTRQTITRGYFQAFLILSNARDAVRADREIPGSEVAEVLVRLDHAIGYVSIAHNQVALEGTRFVPRKAVAS